MFMPLVIAESFYQSQNIRNKRQTENPQPSPSRISLSTVITNPDLGELPNNNSKTILARLRERNPNVNIEDIKVLYGHYDNTYFYFHISAKPNSQYFGWEIVNFSILQKKPISTVITNPDLGELPNDNRETILARLRERNPNVDIKEIIVTFVSDNQDGSQSWKISPRSNSIYYGSNNIRSANNYEIWNN
ncbi:hypothetical protein [Spiroplasma melliferum]|uniref:hypothetical protein n=2 Tax=Spiroplasma melliferum TaxID=2134 RepID=UPI0015E1284D|nr:hypothetical protein [Spiroplasma melliferum]